MMPKRGCDVSVCEIARFFRLNNNGFCQVIPFTVPRKSELFQEDLYPDTQADVPAITADEWWSGTNSDPILVPMTEQGVQKKVILICFEKLESTWHAIFFCNNNGQSVFHTLLFRFTARRFSCNQKTTKCSRQTKIITRRRRKTSTK